MFKKNIFYLFFILTIFFIDRLTKYWAIKNLNSSIAIQGNLDPASLIPLNSIHLEDIILSILNIMKDNRFIFSVGHGLTPDCKIKNIRKVIDIVRNYK